MAKEISNLDLAASRRYAESQQAKDPLWETKKYLGFAAVTESNAPIQSEIKALLSSAQPQNSSRTQGNTKPPQNFSKILPRLFQPGFLGPRLGRTEQLEKVQERLTQQAVSSKPEKETKEKLFILIDTMVKTTKQLEYIQMEISRLKKG